MRLLVLSMLIIYKLRVSPYHSINRTLTVHLIYITKFPTNFLKNRLTSDTGTNMKCPKKQVKDDFVMWCPFIWIAPKSKNFIFGSFSVLKLTACFKKCFFKWTELHSKRKVKLLLDLSFIDSFVLQTVINLLNAYL